MSEETIEQAVIDRFEGDYAVLLVGAARQPLDVPRQQLPRAVHEGDWLQVTLVDGALIAAQRDPAATETARQRIQAKLERLRRGDHLKD